MGRVLRALAEAAIALGVGGVVLGAVQRLLPFGAVVALAVAAGAAALLLNELLGSRVAGRRSARFWRAVADRGVTPDPGAPSNPHILHPDGTRTPLAITEDPEPCPAGHRCYLITMPDGSPIQAGDGDMVGMEQPFDFHVTYLTPEGPREIEGGRDA